MTVLYVTYITFYNNAYYPLYSFIRSCQTKRNFGRESLTRAHVLTDRQAIDEASNKPVSFHF